MEKTNRAVELQEELSSVLVSVTQKRNEMPEQCANLATKVMNLQQLQAENIIVLPKTDVKKLACKYSIHQPIQELFTLTDNELAIQDISSNIAELSERYKSFSKVMGLCNPKSNKEYSN